MKILLLLTTLVFVVKFASGLRCWVCENAKGEADCRKNGHMKKCSHDEQACQVEIRHHQGWGFTSTITKRCKQAHACDNNFLQNRKTAWWPTQCNPRFPTNSVCRCCCDTNRCNYKGLKCWDGPATCNPPHAAPRNGMVDCSNKSVVGSECKFTCKVGYRLVGKETSSCMEDGSWSSMAPACFAQTCRPRFQPPKYGVVSCSNLNKVGSKCRYECNENFVLVGSPQTECMRSGRWSREIPKCEPLSCHPKHEHPHNGIVSCSNRMFGGSECEFTCDYGYTVVGPKVSTCKDDGDRDSIGQWDNKPPLCRPITCRPPHFDPQHGSVLCSSANYLGSLCEFECKRGFALHGEDWSMCQDDFDGDTNGYWSSPPPTCQPIRCEPAHVNPTNGMVQCSQFNFLGSICTFACDNAYSLVGSSTSLCDNESGSGGIWIGDTPTCSPKTCPAGPGVPDNGYTVCTDGNMLGSECEFACYSYYRREGSLYSTCVEGPDGEMQWDRPIPTCLQNHCGDQKLFHGEMECSNGTLPTSTCSFKCVESGYLLYPPEVESNTCLNTTNWDRPQPCCARQCPPYALMDFIIILDSSSSISAPNWFKMIEFVQGFVDDFAVADDATFFGIFRYNKIVDEDTQLLLSENVDMNQILRVLSRIPYDGSGTYTGNALDHALKVMLSKKNGNRHNVKDVVLIITDGKSQDDVSEPARRLRESGAKVFALPIQPPRGQLDMGQMLQITGDDKRIIKDASEIGFKALTSEFSNKLGKEICGDPCEHIRHNHD